MEKHRKILFVISLMILLIFTFTACGNNTPDFVRRPPQDPAELEQILIDNGFENRGFFGGGVLGHLNSVMYIEPPYMWDVVISRTKLSHPNIVLYGRENGVELPARGTKITMEFVMVTYFEEESHAQAFFNIQRPVFNDGLRDMRNAEIGLENYRLNASFTRHENTISFWALVTFNFTQWSTIFF